MISTLPKNTNELMKFINFINDTKENTLPELEKQTNDWLMYEFLLFDYIHLTEEELKQNTDAFYWVIHINKELWESMIIIEDKKIEFKQSLLHRISIFQNELDKYQTEVDEFQHFGDINDLNFYVEKSQNLNTKLTEALNTIDSFNEEEKFFKIKESVYPLRKIVSTVNLLLGNVG